MASGLQRIFSCLARGLAGFGRAVGSLQIYPVARPYQSSRSGFAADVEAMRGDWRKVGGDMQRAIDKVNAEIKPPA